MSMLEMLLSDNELIVGIHMEHLITRQAILNGLV